MKFNAVIKIRFLILIFLAFITAESFGQYPAGSPVAINGKLKVEGRYLRNECGNVVQLRGMSTHGVQWFSNCINSSSIEAFAKDWNGDILRLAMYIQEGGYNNDPTYWKNWIDNVVSECGKQGIYVVIDFHVHIPGDPMLYINEAKEFWSYMSLKHSSKKHVLYEICNEPNGIPWARVKEYANQIIPLIRSNDPNTVVIVGSSSWSQDVDIVSNDRLLYSNLMYSLHFYTHGEKLRTKANKAIAKGLPIIVTEFGTTDPANTVGPFLDAMDGWVAWMYDNKISWGNWSFSDKNELSAALLPGSCAGNWNNTSVSGTWVKANIKSPADEFFCNGDTAYVKKVTEPFLTTPFAVPGKFEAEYYDKGLNGSAYRNYVKANSVFRTDGVEVGHCLDTVSGYAVSNFESGEWLNYSINVALDGKYDVKVRALANFDKYISLEIDGKNLSGLVYIPQTQGFETITIPGITLKKGIHDLKLNAVSIGPVINTIEIVPSIQLSGNRVPEIALNSPSSSTLFLAPASVTLSAYVTDPDGSVAKVEFYIDGKKIAEDVTFPYSQKWNVTTAGTYAFKLVAIDNLGETAYKTREITVLQADTAVGTGLKGEYFNNKTLSGNPVLLRNDTTVNFSWAGGSPSAEINKDLFSARWTGKIKPKYSELYTFYSSSDDGARLYIDDVPLIYAWDNGTKTLQATIQLIGNTVYNIRLEYFDDCCSAKEILSWSSPSLPLQVIPKASLYSTEYFNVPPKVFISSPDSNQVFESPASINITATASDKDGSISKVEFYNGNSLIGTDYTLPFSFQLNTSTTGTYVLKAIAFDNLQKQASSVPVKLVVAPQGGPLGSGLRAHYFNNNNLSGVPQLSKTDPNVDFKWANSPTASINADNFSIRWTGKILPQYSETYTFYTTSDDGVRLFVNNVLVVDNWTNHGSVTNQGTISLQAGVKSDIRLEFYDACCSAEIRLAWSSASLVKQIVPQLNLYPADLEVFFPVVSISSPINNDNIPAGSDITISADISSVNTDILKVEFLNGSVKLGEDLTSPFSFNWTAVPVGSYSIIVKATDKNANFSISKVNVKVVAGLNQKPVISLTSPVSGATYIAPATVTLSASASDQDGTVSKVEFYNGTVKLGEDLTSPYSFEWQNVSKGTYGISAKAIDNSLAETLTPTVNMSVNDAPLNQSPVITLSSPLSGSSYTSPATIAISATASDPDGTVSIVEFYNGNVKIGEDATSPFSFAWTNVFKGSYAISAKAIDNNLASTISSVITVSVNDVAINKPPVVTLTSPLSGAGFIAPATITISATASDPDGTISNVEFYNGNIKLGEDATTPFAFSWNNVLEGTYSITAVATDNNMSKTTSSPISTVVSPASGNNCQSETVPVASNWVLRNSWSDNNNGSGVFSQTDAMRITHRAWGQDNVYIIQTGKKYNVASGKNYSISFDFKNDATSIVKDLEIGFSTGITGSGVILLQPLSVLAAGSATGNFTTKSLNLMTSAGGDVYLTIRQIWSSQVSSQSNTYIKNLAICPITINARMDNTLYPEDSENDLSLLIAPNPSEESFFVTVKGTYEPLTITVSTLTGEIVYYSENEFGGQKFKLGTNFYKGIYLLKVQHKENVLISKLRKF